jgi:hypothetical protein
VLDSSIIFRCPSFSKLDLSIFYSITTYGYPLSFNSPGYPCTFIFISLLLIAFKILFSLNFLIILCEPKRKIAKTADIKQNMTRFKYKHKLLSFSYLSLISLILKHYLYFFSKYILSFCLFSFDNPIRATS